MPENVSQASRVDVVHFTCSIFADVGLAAQNRENNCSRILLEHLQKIVPKGTQVDNSTTHSPIHTYARLIYGVIFYKNMTLKR